MRRSFFIGSQWLYYKLYTGVKTADLILIEKLSPIIEELKTTNAIQKWFFIRYNDPDEHLRIRFYIENQENVAYVISKLYPVLNELVEDDLIWKIQTDTYQRELERYGKETIEESETLFWFDSEMIISYLSLKSSFVKKEMELFFSFISIDNFFNSFSIPNAHKLTIINELQNSFKKEFNVDKVFKKKLDSHYRELQDEIDYFLSGKAITSHPEIYNIIHKKQHQINKEILLINNSLQVLLSDFLKHHIHMMINRQYTSKQRMYELIIYDHLYRYYKTQNFKK